MRSNRPTSMVSDLGGPVTATVIPLDNGFGPVPTIRVEQGRRLIGYFTSIADIERAGIGLHMLTITGDTP